MTRNATQFRRMSPLSFPNADSTDREQRYTRKVKGGTVTVCFAIYQMSELIGSHCAALVLFRVENKSRIWGGTLQGVVPVFVTGPSFVRVFCCY